MIVLTVFSDEKVGLEIGDGRADKYPGLILRVCAVAEVTVSMEQRGLLLGEKRENRLEVQAMT